MMLRSAPSVVLAAVACLGACGDRTGLDVDRPYDGGAQSEDAAAPQPDASAPPCADGTVVGSVVGDIYGNVVLFAGGASLPAGSYRITYVDGCMKYSGDQNWTVNATDAADRYTWWLVDGSSDDLLVPPGTVGYLPGAGGYDTFDACVAANAILPPVDFDFAGGQLGVWLEDSPYSDNVAGDDGRNPSWSITCGN
jgi:hypothetical protein